MPDRYSDPLNPFGDPFKIQRTPKGGIKKPKKHYQVPEPRALYDLQTDILKALSIMETEDYEGGARRQMRNAYKIINRYLRQYAQGTNEELELFSDDNL